jgi:hypothetical protein
MFSHLHTNCKQLVRKGAPKSSQLADETAPLDLEKSAAMPNYRKEPAGALASL